MDREGELLMPDTFTPELNLTKVGINESDDTWGVKLNDNADKIDAGVVSDRAKITALEARCTLLENEALKASWVGEIRMHSGSVASIANIPGGVWRLCDGQYGTVNLVDKFVMGVGATGTAPGATGGAREWVGKVSSTAWGALRAIGHAITWGQMPNHGHPAAVNDPGHQHEEPNGSASFLRGPLVVSAAMTPGSANLSDEGGQPGTVKGTGISVTVGGAGNSEAHDHALPDLNHDHSATVPTLPPYLALCFVQRVA
jgi:hypothetical protein